MRALAMLAVAGGVRANAAFDRLLDWLWLAALTPEARAAVRENPEG